MRRMTPFWLSAIALALVVAGSTAGSASAAISRQQAYKWGLQGKTTSYILRRAFPRVRYLRQQEAPIRVLLADDVLLGVVMAQVSMSLKNSHDASWPEVRLIKGHRYAVTRNQDIFTVRDVEGTRTANVDLWRMRGAPLFDAFGSGYGIRLAEPRTINRRYRGVIRMQYGRGTRRVRIVNIVDTDAYLRGTLPGDMPAYWGKRAPATLRAGAIALRSRALAQRKLPSAPFDFTASDPKYLGLDGERRLTTAAVYRTRNLTLRRGSWPYPASFSGLPAMGSSAFQPLTGRPVPVAFGPERPVDIADDPAPVDRTVSQRVRAAVRLAMSLRGTPYRWGGSAPGGFDCSGLLYYVFGRQGINLPRVAEDQARVGKPVRRMADLLLGDSVFFADSSGYIHHIGIYIGNGKMVHAPQSGSVVKVSAITSTYYRQRFAGGRRYK